MGIRLKPQAIEAMRSRGRSVEEARAGDAELGPLSLLPGVWKSKGLGWNMIALPFAAPGAPPFRLLVNQYDEELKFSLVDKGVPNRGITDGSPRQDLNQLIVTLDYEQSIRQIASADFPESGLAGKPGLAIHHEPGLWLYMTNHVVNEIDVGRLATIPHGNSLLALGTSKVIEYPDKSSLIPSISGLPIGIENVDIDDPANAYLAPYKHFHSPPFKGAVTDPGFPGFDPLAPSELLKLALKGMNVRRTTVLEVDTAVQTAGVLNIPFIVRQADARRMVSTFWIHELEETDDEGKPRCVLQYLQDVSLDFLPQPPVAPGLIRWPHVSINTLTKQ